MRFICIFCASVAILALGCGGDEGGAGSSAASDSKAFVGFSTHADLLELSHLADIDDQGLFVDFGTAAQAKYTNGNWRSGWGRSRADGDLTYAEVGKRGRIYFWVPEAKAMTVRLRLKAEGTKALTPYINNSQIQSLVLDPEKGFADYDFVLPADQMRRGENYLLLTFGGATTIDGEEVSARVDSLRVVPGESIAAGFEAPASVKAKVSVGGEERAALVLRRATSLGHFVELPPEAKLGVSLGFEGEGEAGVKIFATVDGGARQELLNTKAGGQWTDHLVDLGALAGKVAQLELVADGEGKGRVAFATPRVLVPEPKAASMQPAKNVIVLLIDTLRADRLKPYNPKSRVKTPVLDGLAAEGAVFGLAQSPENWTKPSVASVLTGLHPTTHGANQTESRLPADATLLSEHLKAKGFKTGSFIANGYVSDRFGFDQGWDHYTNYIRERKSTEAENVFRETGDWIEKNKGGRFFAYVQTIDPHVPYDPPEEYLKMYDAREYTGPVQPRMTPEQLEQAKRKQLTFTASDQRRLEALYDGEISQHDHFLGLFIERLKKLGVWEDTLLVVTSDHGEEFNDHGSWGHGHSVYQELLHVPLVFYRSGAIEKRHVAGAVSTLSIPATVCELVGVERIAEDEGGSLAGWIFGRRPAMPPVAFSYFHEERRVITTANHKFLVRGNLTTGLFDLQADPLEKKEIELDHQPVAQRYLRTLLGQFLAANDRGNWLAAEQTQRRRLNSEQTVIDAELKGQLGALGYATN